MSRKQIRFLFSGALMALFALSTLANTGLTPVSFAADTDSNAIVATADTVPSAASSSMPAVQFAPAGCSAITPCPVLRTGDGWEMYSGGPAIYLDRFADED